MNKIYQKDKKLLSTNETYQRPDSTFRQQVSQNLSSSSFESTSTFISSGTVKRTRKRIQEEVHLLKVPREIIQTNENASNQVPTEKNNNRRRRSHIINSDALENSTSSSIESFGKAAKKINICM